MNKHMMSKKHYQRIAEVLAGELSLARELGNASEHQIRFVTLSLADVFAQDNPRFDRKRFYDAVGITAPSTHHGEG